jgi:7-cyano-7-deazaguanine synthase
MTALVVHSGGLDSTVALCWAEKQYGRAETITFDYGQRHRSELQAAKTIADYLNVNHLEVEVPLGTGGVLTTDEEMPHMTYDELAEADSIVSLISNHSR